MRQAWIASIASATLLTSLLACSSATSGTGATSSGRDGSTAPTVPSCQASGAGLSNCGAGEESCCASAPVPGGAFILSYDGISENGLSKGSTATVSDVTVDRYEVTVGRFRAFVAAEVAGWRPSAGTGKHSELKGGGLNAGAETGWDASWTANLATTTSGWAANLSCDPSYATWTASAGSLEDHPINCVDWYEAYAFCIWDGGFLPSEAEWNYTASGGSEQRLYPWSLAYPPGSDMLDCSLANYSTSSTACVMSGTNKVGSESPMGDGRWGHSDMAGNVFEWVLDWSSTYPASCDDCANLTPAQYRVIRGGAFDGSSACLLNSLRETSVPDGRSPSTGLRCARPPT